jgi:uncharacterized protein YecT (DUF1311 family)
MSICGLIDAKQADLELDAVYKKLMKKIHPGGRAKLRAAQNAWIVYRKKQCEFNTLGSVGGTVNSMVLFYCYAYPGNTQCLLNSYRCSWVAEQGIFRGVFIVCHLTPIARACSSAR